MVFTRPPTILAAVAKVASDAMHIEVDYFSPFVVKVLVEERSLLTPICVGGIHEGFKHVLHALHCYCVRILLRGKVWIRVLVLLRRRKMLEGVFLETFVNQFLHIWCIVLLCRCGILGVLLYSNGKNFLELCPCLISGSGFSPFCTVSCNNNNNS